MKFTAILSPEAGGGYSVVPPAVPGCVSQGKGLPLIIETRAVLGSLPPVTSRAPAASLFGNR